MPGSLLTWTCGVVTSGTGDTASPLVGTANLSSPFWCGSSLSCLVRWKLDPLPLKRRLMSDSIESVSSLPKLPVLLLLPEEMTSSSPSSLAWAVKSCKGMGRRGAGSQKVHYKDSDHNFWGEGGDVICW